MFVVVRVACQLIGQLPEKFDSHLARANPRVRPHELGGYSSRSRAGAAADLVLFENDHATGFLVGQSVRRAEADDPAAYDDDG